MQILANLPWSEHLKTQFGIWPLYPIISLIITLALTPLMIRWASKKGWLDRPGFRKVHLSPMPRLGGVAVFIATWSAWGIFSLLNPDVIPYESISELKGLFFASLIIWILGIYDDLYGANALQKLSIQSIAALIVIYYGVQIQLLNKPFSPGDIFIPKFWVWVLSFIWIIVVTNAINLIDGLDGLAAGICMITFGTIFFIAKDMGRSPHLPFLLIILAAACLGFLKYNFAPARIFLGDSGSLFLGFMMACLSVSGTTKRSAAIVMFGPPLVLALPMADTILAVVRRFFRKESLIPPLPGEDTKRKSRRANLARRLREIFNADQEHIHHALLEIGLSHKRAVIILYLVTAILGATAYSVALYSHVLSTFIVLSALSLSLAWLRRKFRKTKIKKNGANHEIKIQKNLLS